MLRRSLLRRLVVFGIVGVGAFLAHAACGFATAQAAENPAADVLGRLGTTRGVCVLLDQLPADRAIALARKSELIVYVQVPTEAAARACAEQVEKAGLLGTRVYVEAGPWSHLHLADNLADAVIVTPNAVATAEPHRAELLRVVNPLGKVLVGEQEIKKPFPKGVDDWTHHFHGPDNNPQSLDKVAKAPYLTQFLGEPWYVPMPGLTVSSAGRVFTAHGHVAFHRRAWPWIHTLVALNGYNGTILWKRQLEEGFMIHRNTLVATPELVYIADNRSCKVLDAATGEVRGEIAAPEDAAGPCWKWMGLEGGVLYALVGETEPPDPVVRGTRNDGGWPWAPMSQAYDSPNYRWGFGRTFFAYDLKNKKVLWTHTEQKPIDTRAVTMASGRIFAYSHPEYLACLSTKEGRPLWRNADKDLLEAIGQHFRAQTWIWGFSSTSYMKCSDKAVYFAGPTRTKLVAASADDGHLLWSHPDGNYQLVLRDEGLFALGSDKPSLLFDPLTGRVLKELNCRRAACTRATGACDSIFTRGEAPVNAVGRHAGTMRLAVADVQPRRISLMRPPCQDGVMVANGHLYWGPWMCDCHLTLVGQLSLGPAGDFAFGAEARDEDRGAGFQPASARGAGFQPAGAALLLTSTADEPSAPGRLETCPTTGRLETRPTTGRLETCPTKPGDWPAYRADNQRSAASPAEVPAAVHVAWTHQPPQPSYPAAPVTAGGLVFVSGGDGVVRALDGATGECRWKGLTGGRIYYPAAIEDGRLFAGSGDGCVWAFEAATGKPLWRFRAAPAERKIAEHGRLISTWPVGSGVLVDKAIVYAAAGLASWDGTHVYALDAATGKIRWQNNTSGHLAGEGKVSGVSVQGHLLLDDEKLYLAGGNVVSPAVYDAKDGKCLNTLPDEWVFSPRGSELTLVGRQVAVFGTLLYSPYEPGLGPFRLPDLYQARQGDVLIRSIGGPVMRIEAASAAEAKPKAVWTSPHLAATRAVALGTGAVVAAGQLPQADPSAEPRYAVAALAVADGRVLWSETLPAVPRTWGIALDSAGRVSVALQDGRVICLAAK